MFKHVQKSFASAIEVSQRESLSCAILFVRCMLLVNLLASMLCNIIVAIAVYSLTAF